MKRRLFMVTALGAAAGLPFVRAAASKEFDISRSDAEWRAMLTPLQYKVMRQEGTERAGSSPLDKVYDAGCITVAAVTYQFIAQRINMTVALVGRAFTKRFPKRLKPRQTIR